MTRLLALTLCWLALPAAIFAAYLKGVEDGSSFVLCEISRVLGTDQQPDLEPVCQTARTSAGLRAIKAWPESAP